MDSHVDKFYRQFSDETPKGAFHKVVALHEAPDASWEELSKTAPALPKGWFELSQMSPEERIEMLQAFWLSKLPFCPHITEDLDAFFKKLDDIAIFLVQPKFEDPWKAEMVYSLKDDGGFFRGGAPATEDQLYNLQKLFPETILPEDYAAFLTIHNGFSKATDTGIISTDEFEERLRVYEALFAPNEIPTTTAGKPVNPHSLIPFYESFGMPYYQCFWTDWWPETEMGNVYFNGINKQISSVDCPQPESEAMAFKSFSDWLFFYLETVS
ncbi:MAG: SMI1/KNR4 family protein [Chlamydiia bacterium]|nr:SMI1/KNR4 family protein [Chlamydiia bacterium]